MDEAYYVGAYWLGRQETAAVCARRAETLFRLLARIDPTWSHWFSTGASRQEALSRPIEPTAATFEALFAQKKYQLPSNGFRLWTWNGEQQSDSTGLTFTCGSSSDFASDICVLNPPRRGPIAARVLTTPVMTEVLRAMILAWEPEWGIVTSSVHRDMVTERPKMGTFVGWMVYFSHHRGEVPPLPASVRVEPVEDKGTLIVLTPERFTAANPEHVELATHVHKALDHAGLLGPLRPAALP